MTSSSNDSDTSSGFVNPSLPNSNAVVNFSPGERYGAIAMGMAALTSCVLVSVLLIYIIISAILAWRQRRSDSATPFFRKPIAILMICLFVADLIHSVAGVLQFKWAHENKVYEGAACTIQATILTIGDLGSTVWSCAIASHTFSSIALGKQWSRGAVYITVIVGWSFIGILTAIGPTALENPSKGPFFGIAGSWCFITSNYSVQRLGIFYVPWFVAAIFIVVFYILVFLVLRGHVSFLRDVRTDDAILRERITIAKRMLWYPAAFLACIFPITIIRIIGMRNDNIPYAVWTFGVFVIFLLGAVDSVIYATTRIIVQPTGRLPLRGLRRRPFAPVNGGGRRRDDARKLEYNDIDHPKFDASGYTPWAEECPKQMSPHAPCEAASPAVAIHVKLEQTGEI